MKCDIYKNKKLHHTLVFHLHGGTMVAFSSTKISSSITVAWDYILLHYEAQVVTVNNIYILLLDLIQNMSRHP